MTDRISRRARLVGLVAAGTMLAALLPTGSALAITGGDFSISSPATGGANIPSTNAGGAWTTLVGPTISVAPSQTADLIMPAVPIVLTLPGNFEFNPAITTAPTINSGCQLNATTITYSGAGSQSTTAQVGIDGTHNTSPCTITFGGLQVRPISASGGTGGDIIVSAAGIAIGSGGAISMSTPVGPLTLSITSPTMNNNAIIWGQSYIDIKTSGTSGTKFQIQASTDEKTWTPLKDSSGGVLTFTISSSGTTPYRYTPIRNYWYRSVAGDTMSNVVRITVRQTCDIRPIHSGTVALAVGSKITFTTTSRPARSDLPTANVIFQVWQKSGSGSWVLHTQLTKKIDANGNATWPVTFGTSGSYYVRAQTQPTSVNSNSFWTPNQYYDVK